MLTLEKLENYDVNGAENYAMELFHKGFTCAETLMYTLNKYLNLELDEKTFSMSSGFPWGLGGGGCICGALAGASMIIGTRYGRMSYDETRSDKCFPINKELHDEFKKACGGTCCRVLMKGLDRDDPKRKENCSNYVKNALKITVELLKKYEKM
ncbi:MAG: C_GCAxxG_C_C family protein [Lachnospiraceae bacterium]|nr:C_GCAxxG_C_C family protein [Lachnospiraceae bacterium]